MILWIRFEVIFIKTPFSLISHLNSSSNLTKFQKISQKYLNSLWIRPVFTIIPFNSLLIPQIGKFGIIFDAIPHEIDDLAVSSRQYAQAIIQGQADKAVSAPDERMTSRRPRTLRRPVDPRKEGRCFRCLARDHLARECRDPIKCRLCRQGGHRQAFCPLQQHSRTQPINTGLQACLVGEPREIDPQWAHVLGEIQTLCPNLSSPDCHRLDSGDIFLQGLSKEDWRRIHGKTQQIPGDGTITWRRPRPTDGATPPQKTRKSLEARGIPLGFTSGIICRNSYNQKASSVMSCTTVS